MKTEELLFPWETFLNLQELTNTLNVGPSSHATDEAFDALLEEWSAGEAPMTVPTLKQRFSNLVTNRAKKYRSRLLASSQVLNHEIRTRPASDPSEVAAIRELAKLALDEVSVADAELLVEIFTKGIAYHELSAKMGKPVGTLKARVSRATKRIRASSIAEAIRSTLKAA